MGYNLQESHVIPPSPPRWDLSQLSRNEECATFSEFVSGKIVDRRLFKMQMQREETILQIFGETSLLRKLFNKNSRAGPHFVASSRRCVKKFQLDQVKC